jgi:alkylation response protein AidB-like acyl-CoA dehydrogenase
MDFSFTPRHQRIAAETAALAPLLADPTLQERDRQGLFSHDLWTTLCRHGLHRLTMPEAFGGQAHGAQDMAVALEALGEHCEDTGLVFALAAHLCACVHPLVQHGDADQKQHWLPRIAQGNQIGAHAITEEDAGSDVAAMQTTAVRDGDGYRIDGVKRYITNAPVCDFIVLHARTAHTGSFLDYSTFVLDRHTPGVQVSPQPLEKTGLRTTAMGDIRFDGVRLPASQRVGLEGSGGPIFQSSMEWERTCLFAMYLGVMRRQLRQTCRRAETRVQFGKPLIEQQAVAHRLADMQLRWKAGRLATYRAAWSLDQGRGDAAASAIAKLLVSEAAVQNGLDALHIHGASGVLCGDIERQLRNALPSTLFSGTTDVLKNQLVRLLRSESRQAASGAI